MTKPRRAIRIQNRSYLRATLLCSLLFSFSDLAVAETPEETVAREASQLRNITDSQWNEMVSGKSSETYEVQKGDTLWDISKRLFGDSYYWPKMWTYNSGIRNPHFISPGKKIAFIGGSSENFPKLTPNLNETGNDGSGYRVATGSSGSHEYDKIPGDWWTPPKPNPTIVKNYDAYGLEKEIKISLPSRFTFRVPGIANETTIPFLGEVVASRRSGAALGQHETIFLRSSGQDLQVGTVYSILAEPEYVKEKRSDRSGYIYKTLGEVKIVGVKDELYVGLITVSYDVIRRGDHVYPLLPNISEIKPVQAPNALEALIIDNFDATRNTSQYRFIHFDRGIEDGVQIGQVFRVYDYVDPVTKNKITDSDFLMNADALIVHTTAQFSTALVIRARDTISRGDFGVSLVDVSDIQRVREDKVRDLNEKKYVSPEDKELDELDELDRQSGEGLGRKEEEEIKELDTWDRLKDENKEDSAPDSNSSSTDDLDSLEQQTDESSKENELDQKEKDPTVETDTSSETDPNSLSPGPVEPNIDTMETLEKGGSKEEEAEETPALPQEIEKNEIPDQTLDSVPYLEGTPLPELGSQQRQNPSP